MTEHLWVLAGAALGGPARYLVDRGLRSRGQTVLPWGTISVNIVGSFVLGLVLGLDSRHCLPQALTLGIGVGFCGALTTFSTFSYESVRLYESGARPSDHQRTGLGVRCAGGRVPWVSTWLLTRTSLIRR